MKFNQRLIQDIIRESAIFLIFSDMQQKRQHQKQQQQQQQTILKKEKKKIGWGGGLIFDLYTKDTTWVPLSAGAFKNIYGHRQKSMDMLLMIAYLFHRICRYTQIDSYTCREDLVPEKGYKFLRSDIGYQRMDLKPKMV